MTSNRYESGFPSIQIISLVVTYTNLELFVQILKWNGKKNMSKHQTYTYTNTLSYAHILSQA